MEAAALQVELRAADVPPSLLRLLAEDEESDRAWVRTAQALARSRGNIPADAEALRVHTDTVYYRTTAARALTGLDLRSPDVLADIQLVQASGAFGRYVA